MATARTPSPPVSSILVDFVSAKRTTYEELIFSL